MDHQNRLHEKAACIPLKGRMNCPASKCKRFSIYRVGCRAKFGLVVGKCEELCSLMSCFGPDKDMEAQDLMARLTPGCGAASRLWHLLTVIWETCSRCP